MAGWEGEGGASAADPLFEHLAGGTVPSIDTVYRYLCRFDAPSLPALHALMARHGHAGVKSPKSVHLDIDNTVEPLFGRQEGALPGPNPHHHARPSLHPVLAVVAETRLCCDAKLGSGDHSLSIEDAQTIGGYVREVVSHLRRKATLTVRMDAGGDCSEILCAIDAAGAFFNVKLKLSADLVGAILFAENWRTVEVDADGNPLRQVAEIPFQRRGSAGAERSFRVVATRYLDRDTAKQVQLWPDLEYAVQAFVTNNTLDDAEDIVADYDGRAEIEPAIAERKNGIGIGKVPGKDFNANHAAFLLKLLTHNLVRRFVGAVVPELQSWRLPWLWRYLLRVPGRLLRSGRCWTLRLPTDSFPSSGCAPPVNRSSRRRRCFASEMAVEPARCTLEPRAAGRTAARSGADSLAPQPWVGRQRWGMGRDAAAELRPRRAAKPERHSR